MARRRCFKNPSDGEWNNDPIAFKVARSGRVDLMQKLIDACDDEDRIEMLNTLIDNDGWNAPKQYKGSYGYKIPLDVAKTEEMKKLIQDNM